MDEVSGVLCRKVRDKDSTLEDVVISVKSNVNGQKQIAKANVHVYVGGIYHDRQINCAKRSQDLQKICARIFDSFRTGSAKCELLTQSEIKLDGTDEYLINNEIKYTIINE